jgi:hypothetical protein
LHTNGSANSAVEVDMKCRCPACGRTTWVPEEQLDFVVRCDRCRALLLTRTRGETPPDPGNRPVEVVPLEQVAHALRDVPPPSSNLDIAEYMARRQASGDRAIVTAQPPKPRTPQARRAPGLAAWSIVFAIACLAVAAIIVVLARSAPATARAERPAVLPPPKAAVATHVTKNAAATPAHVTPKVPAASDDPAPTANGDGELFPDVPAKK